MERQQKLSHWLGLGALPLNLVTCTSHVCHAHAHVLQKNFVELTCCRHCLERKQKGGGWRWLWQGMVDAFVYYTRHGMVQHDIIISASKPEQKERPRFQASTKPLNHALQCDQHFARFGKKQLSNATPKQTCRAPAAQHQLHSRPYLQGLHVHHPATSLPGQLGSSWTYFGSAAGFPWQAIEYDRILTSWLHPSLIVSSSDMVDGLFSQFRSNFNQEGMRHALPNGHF